MKTFFEKLEELRMTITDKDGDVMGCYHGSVKTLIKSEVEAMLREMLNNADIEGEPSVSTLIISIIAKKNGFNIE